MNYLGAYEQANRRCIELLAEKTAHLSLIKHEQKRREELAEENARLRSRIMELELLVAAADKMQKALLGLLDPFKDDPCYYDHHGNCQAHFVSNPCPVKQAKEAIKSYEEAGR